jgi:hypothetical protein
MVNKATSFKKQGKPKKGNFKKGAKKAAAPPEKPSWMGEVNFIIFSLQYFM